jgi:TRAP-type C4-dicarboxylate transport system permease small subunit
MKKTVRAFISVSLLLFVASFATCYFGVNYSLNQIPPDVRKQMTDTDWIGSEWVGRGLLLMLCAIVLALVAIGIWLIQRKSK